MNARRFECTLCGECCRRPGIVVLATDEVEAIAEHVGTDVEALIDTCDLEPRDGEWWMRLRGRHCPFLADGRCSIQPVKPRQCQTYPFWPEILQSDATWEAEATHCPGIGRGPVFGEPQIRKMLELLGE